MTSGLTRRSHHTATLLTDGHVLVAGGLDAQSNVLSKIEVLDYRTGQSTTLPISLKTARSHHTATLLPDGTVLLWGGHNATDNPLSYGEIIDPTGPSAWLASSPAKSFIIASVPWLAASIPQSGESSVLTTQVISLRFSKPLNLTSLNSSTVTLRAESGNVASNVVPAEGGMLAFITPLKSLQNGTD